MSEIITEALLEMHFHRAIIDFFTLTYGANFLKLLKPSTQQEVWIGFDQGWVQTSLTTKQLLTDLKQAVNLNASTQKSFYLGYFLQFKVVQKITRKSDHMPDKYLTPYYRVELSLKPNHHTNLSQHESLLRLSRLPSASVCYACAMFFDLMDIYQPVNLNHLRCVDFSGSPPGWVTNERHFICFQKEEDLTPYWCSTPVLGNAMGFKEWASSQSFGPKPLTSSGLLNLLQESINTLLSTEQRQELGDIPPDSREPRAIQLDLLTDEIQPNPTIATVLPESFTIVELSERNSN